MRDGAGIARLRMAGPGALVLVLVLSGCATVAPREMSEPTPSAVAQLVAWQPDPAVEEPEAWPCDYDAALTAPFGCTTFASTGGSAAGAEMGWLAVQPLRLQVSPPMDSMFDHGADLVVAVTTPCNSLTVPVTRAGALLTATASGAMRTEKGCQESAALLAEEWTAEFVSRPMTSAVDGTTLVLTSGTDEIAFVAVASD